MNTKEFLKIRTNYLGIGIRVIFFLGVLFLMVFIEILAFFLLFGSGAGSGRISDLWYVDLTLNYLPILLVGAFLVFKILKESKRQEYVKFKTNLIVLLILVFLTIAGNQLLEFYL